MARDPNSKHVVLLNNDAIPIKNSLSELVELLNAVAEHGFKWDLNLDIGAH